MDSASIPVGIDAGVLVNITAEVSVGIVDMGVDDAVSEPVHNGTAAGITSAKQFC